MNIVGNTHIGNTELTDPLVNLGGALWLVCLCLMLYGLSC